jgi:hypothetical protein
LILKYILKYTFRKTDLLPFVAVAYEPFHLTGDPGILEEVDDYVRGALA